MATIDKIVENEIVGGFFSKHELFKRVGFDYQYSISYNLTEPKREYSLLEFPKIQIIFDGLYTNAIKAIYGTEEPHRAANMEELKKISGRVELKVYEKGNNYVLSCQDNGGGIPEKNKPLIFEEGFSTFGTSGNGLGFISRFIRELNGRIYFESEAGKGTTFYVELPK